MRNVEYPPWMPRANQLRQSDPIEIDPSTTISLVTGHGVWGPVVQRTLSQERSHISQDIVACIIAHYEYFQAQKSLCKKGAKKRDSSWVYKDAGIGLGSHITKSRAAS